MNDLLLLILWGAAGGAARLFVSGAVARAIGETVVPTVQIEPSTGRTGAMRC